MPLVSYSTVLEYLLLTVYQVYFFLPETNGWKLETLDTIFNEAHEQGRDPVSVERAWRKNGWKHRSDSTAARSELESDDNKTVVVEDEEAADGRIEKKE